MPEKKRKAPAKVVRPGEYTPGSGPYVENISRQHDIGQRLKLDYHKKPKFAFIEGEKFKNVEARMKAIEANLPEENNQRLVALSRLHTGYLSNLAEQKREVIKEEGEGSPKLREILKRELEFRSKIEPDIIQLLQKAEKDYREYYRMELIERLSPEAKEQLKEDLKKRAEKRKKGD